MKKEDTVFNVKNEYAQNVQNQEIDEEITETAADDENKKSNKWGKTAAAVGLGAAAGGISAFAAEKVGEIPVDILQQEDEGSNLHQLVDEDVQIASSVNDDMTFNEAFAAAREELGKGAVFEWEGKLYHTYSAEEWASMSQEEKDDFAKHFSWGGKSDSNTDDGTHEIALEVDNESSSTDDEMEVALVDEDSDDVSILGVDDNSEKLDIEILSADEDVVKIDIEDDDILSDDLDDFAFEESDMYASNDGDIDYINDADTGYDMV